MSTHESVGLTALAGRLNQVVHVQRVTDGHVQEVAYDRVCFATGALPRQPLSLDQEAVSRVFTVRDTDSVLTLADKLCHSRRIMVVGNGGIALELIDMLSRLGQHEIHWVVKHDGIGDAFFDRDAGAFLQSVLAARGVGMQQASQLDASDFRGGESLAGDAVPSNRTQDAAAGPAWSEQLLHGFKGAVPADGPACWHVHTHVGCEVKSISAGHLANQSASAPCEARVQLTTGQVISVDVIVMATGVAPNVGWAPAHWRRADDGGLCVDPYMQVTGAGAGVFAAGDAATAHEWESLHWHQMRLWSQARLTGRRAGACMVDINDADVQVDGNFELFTHSTRFFGQRVVLLGRYNAQGIDAATHELVSYSRVVPPAPGGDRGSFARVLLADGRMRGAVLVGDEACELCESFEHLILDALDLSTYGPHILDPDFDVEDYFD